MKLYNTLNDIFLENNAFYVCMSFYICCYSKKTSQWKILLNWVCLIYYLICSIMFHHICQFIVSNIKWTIWFHIVCLDHCIIYIILCCLRRISSVLNKMYPQWCLNEHWFAFKTWLLRQYNHVWKKKVFSS